MNLELYDRYLNTADAAAREGETRTINDRGFMIIQTAGGRVTVIVKPVLVPNILTEVIKLIGPHTSEPIRPTSHPEGTRIDYRPKPGVTRAHLALLAAAEDAADAARTVIVHNDASLIIRTTGQNEVELVFPDTLNRQPLWEAFLAVTPSRSRTGRVTVDLTSGQDWLMRYLPA